MNERMMYLVALITEATRQLKIKTFYTDLFRSTGNVITSPTPEICIDDLEDYFVEAGIVEKGEALPILGEDGFNRHRVQPDDVGGTFPYTAQDRMMMTAGSTQLINGQQVTATESIEAEKTRKIAAAIVNKTEQICAEAALKGIYTGKTGTLDVGTKADTAISVAKGSVVSKILELAIEFEDKHQTTPFIGVGSKVFLAMRDELVAQGLNLSSVTVNLENDMKGINIGAYNVALMPSRKGADGNKIDASDLALFLAKEVAAIAFAAVEYGDIVNNEANLFTGEYIAYDESVTSRGKGGISGASSPFAYIAQAEKHKKYKVTITTA